MISSPEEVYEFARQLIENCQSAGYETAATDLDEAFCVGSSALESLGAIRRAVLTHYDVFREFTSSEALDAALKYVDRVYGRT